MSRRYRRSELLGLILLGFFYVPVIAGLIAWLFTFLNIKFGASFLPLLALSLLSYTFFVIMRPNNIKHVNLLPDKLRIVFKRKTLNVEYSDIIMCAISGAKESYAVSKSELPIVIYTRTSGSYRVHLEQDFHQDLWRRLSGICQQAIFVDIDSNYRLPNSGSNVEEASRFLRKIFRKRIFYFGVVSMFCIIMVILLAFVVEDNARYFGFFLFGTLGIGTISYLIKVIKNLSKLRMEKFS